MKAEIFFSDKIPLSTTLKRNAVESFQAVANRLAQGHCRYGAANAKQKYMSRLKMELDAYKRSGNVEQIYNIMTYAILELTAPENKKFHFNAFADSVTRGKI